MNDELISENDVARFYRNSQTRALEKHGSNIGLKCMIAERKDGTLKEFVLLDRKHNPIRHSTSYEDMAVFIDVRKKLAKR